MAIDQCADDSAGITVVELPSGAMQWRIKPADASIQVVGETVAGSVPGVRVGMGQGLGRDAIGRPYHAWSEARILRSGAGQHTGVTTAHGQLVLQNLEGAITNSTPTVRDVWVGWSIPWIDLLDVNNSAPTVIGLFGLAWNSPTLGYSELFHMHHDFPGNTSRRIRMPGSFYGAIYTLNPGVTLTMGLKCLCNATYAGGNFTAFIPGSRIDALWSGGPTP